MSWDFVARKGLWQYTQLFVKQRQRPVGNERDVPARSLCESVTMGWSSCGSNRELLGGLIGHALAQVLPFHNSG
jgi:hypothetical protein